MPGARIQLEVQGLTLTRGGRPLLADCSFVLEGPGLVLISGENGVGKTSLLDWLAGLVRARAGRARLVVDGVGRPLQPQDFGYVPQDIVLYEGLTVRDNLSYWGRLAGVPRASLAARCAQASERFELAELLERRVARLSGGQRRRVNLAVATLHAPPLLLCDEALAGLDQRREYVLLDQLEQGVEAGQLILLVAHRCPEAERRAARILHFDGAGGLVERPAGER